MNTKGVPAIVCHDAGGAELLSSWYALNPCDCYFVLEGPAENVFKKKIGFCSVSDVVTATQRCDWLITGSSWQSDLEVTAIRYAKEESKYSIAFLDHWINYRSRLTRNGHLSIPDELWISDHYGYALACRELPEVNTVRMVSNPYITNALDTISKYKRPYRPNILNVLYICENISSHAFKSHGDGNYWGYTELDALRLFLTRFLEMKCDSTTRIVVRPHPSEARSKYEALVSEYEDLKVQLSNDRPLESEIASHDWVVGCNSTALVIALMAGKRVISCIPRQGRKCVLPHEEIEKWV